MKKLILLFVIYCFVLSCTTVQEGTDQNQDLINSENFHSNNDEVSVLTIEQEAAFNALNSIQVQGHHLYSTFSGIDHDCFPPDTSFVISKDEFLIAMEELLSRYYTDILPEQQAKLAAKAVLAQENYVVLKCIDYSTELGNEVNANVQMSGTWILPKVLGRRDVIIEW